VVVVLLVADAAMDVAMASVVEALLASRYRSALALLLWASAAVALLLRASAALALLSASAPSA
jgi:hypothetical protein